MTVLHTGATKKYVAGWDLVFGGKARSKSATSKKKPAAGKKPSAKKAKSRGKR